MGIISFLFINMTAIRKNILGRKLFGVLNIFTILLLLAVVLNMNAETGLVEAKGRYSKSRSSRSYKKSYKPKKKIIIVRRSSYGGYSRGHGGYSRGYVSYSRGHRTSGGGGLATIIGCLICCCCCAVIGCFVVLGGRMSGGGSHHSGEEEVHFVEEHHSD